MDMETTNFNIKAASLIVAAAVSAIAPVAKGYFSVSVEIGGGYVASVGGQSYPVPEILSARVWTVDDDLNEVEVNIPENYIDTEIIEEAIAGRSV